MASISTPRFITRQESQIKKSPFISSSAEYNNVGVGSRLPSTAIWRQLAAASTHPTWPVARIRKWGHHLSWSHTPTRRPMTSLLSPLQPLTGLPVSRKLLLDYAEPGIRLRAKYSEAFLPYPSFIPAHRLTGLLHLGGLQGTGDRASRSRSFQDCTALTGNQEHLNGWVGEGEEKHLAATERRGASPPFMVRAPGQRVVAIGDLHGDWDKSLAALRLAGVVEEYGPIGWAGGATILVQVGDVLDRGRDEVAIMSLLRYLHLQAVKEGGAVYQLNGNHETMNVAGEFRYVTYEGFLEASDFVEHCKEEKGGDWGEAFRTWWAVSRSRRKEQGGGVLTRGTPRWMQWGDRMRGMYARHLLFKPGGPLALELSRHSVVLLVNETLFAHGGILPHHVTYGLERMNEELSSWMRAEVIDGRGGNVAPMPFVATRGFDSVVWSRLYSQEQWESNLERGMACNALTSVLDDVGASRLVVGHTVQIGGANSACGGRVWRIDVGMSSGVAGAPPQVLEIKGNEVFVSRTKQVVDANIKSRL